MMTKWLRTGLLVSLLGCTPALLAQNGDGFAAKGASECLGCHDFGEDSPVHNVMAGSHGTAGDAAEMAGRRGCEDCHGPSANHANAPTQISPAVSFGPRWTASVAAQNKPCLTCHEGDVAKDWKHSLHMVNDITCVSCHDIHTPQDKVLTEDAQAEVCTVCHKVQKQGIHGMADMAEFNPPCSLCHNPHDHGSAQTQMLGNDSAGCRSCHDDNSLGGSSVSEKAKRYHLVMERPDRTCVDCHTGVAHAAADATPATPPTARTSRDITLFFPGMADSSWLLHSHPGSQPLRQGANCRQCHRGEEAEMGLKQAAGNFKPASKEIRVSFSGDADSLRLTLKWKGARDEKDIALMWGDGTNEAFRRGACFAACHSDLPGMSGNRGQQIDKYLAVSREQQKSIGKPAIVKSEAELEALMAEGNFAVLWRIDLASGKAEAATVLDDVNWRSGAPIRASTKYENGWWTVNIRRATSRQPEHLVTFDPENKYTFGIALHGPDNPGGKHWVSLPLTLNYSGDDTDFRIK